MRTDQIFVFDLGGKILHHPGGDRPMQIPIEWRIHTQIHKDRPEILCVAHLHAHASTLMGIAGRDIVPVFRKATVAHGGIPTWDDPRLVMSDESATALSRTLGKHVACQMRGHGSVVVGETAELCLQNCTFIEENAQYQIEAEALGGAKPFPEEIWDGIAGAAPHGTGGAQSAVELLGADRRGAGHSALESPGRKVSGRVSIHSATASDQDRRVARQQAREAAIAVALGIGRRVLAALRASRAASIRRRRVWAMTMSVLPRNSLRAVEIRADALGDRRVLVLEHGDALPRLFARRARIGIAVATCCAWR